MVDFGIGCADSFTIAAIFYLTYTVQTLASLLFIILFGRVFVCVFTLLFLETVVFAFTGVDNGSTRLDSLVELASRGIASNGFERNTTIIVVVELSIVTTQ